MVRGAEGSEDAGKCKGYCFVTMRREDEAAAAIMALNGVKQ